MMTRSQRFRRLVVPFLCGLAGFGLGAFLFAAYPRAPNPVEFAWALRGAGFKIDSIGPTVPAVLADIGADERVEPHCGVLKYHYGYVFDMCLWKYKNEPGGWFKPTDRERFSYGQVTMTVGEWDFVAVPRQPIPELLAELLLNAIQNATTETSMIRNLVARFSGPPTLAPVQVITLQGGER